MPDSRAILPPSRLLEEVAELDDLTLALTSPGIYPSTKVQPRGPAPPAEPMEAEGEADIEVDVEASSMVIGMIFAAVGGTLWTLCLWYVLQKGTPPPRCSGPVDSDDTGLRGTEVHIDIYGDMEKDTDAQRTTEMSCIHQTQQLPEKKTSAYLPL